MTPLTTLLALALLHAPGRPPDAAPDAEFADRFAPLVGTRPAQWRVIWTTSPDSEATISWSTAEPGSTHRVLYDVAGAGADLALVQPTHRDGPYTRLESDLTSAHHHHARLTDLAPSTSYRFVLESDGARSRALSFTTAPADERPFAILAGGDSRSGLRARCFLNVALARIAAEDERVLALSHGGDFVMYGNSWDQWSRWLTHHELTTTRAGRVLPIVPTRGNHDIDALFDEIFDDPGARARNYYRTRLSPSVSLLTLNSNIPVAGDQFTWLEWELETARTDSRWVLTSYHRALYPAVKPPGSAKTFWAPLFDEHGVDVALESDGHCIKRTMRIRGDEPHPEGVVYLGEGGLGVPQREPRSDAFHLQPPAFVANGHHVIRIDFSKTELRTRILLMPEIPARLAAEDFRPGVAPGAPWRYLVADDAPDDWAALDFDASTWPIGEAGFGYGDDDNTTLLVDMHRHHARVHLRHAFDASLLEGARELNLMCRYDDAFIAYLNGVEVARSCIEPPAADSPRREPIVTPHEAGAVESFAIDDWRELIRPGRNVLAIVGHNRSSLDRDFTLDPWLAGERTNDPSRTGLVPTVVDEFELTPRRR